MKIIRVLTNFFHSMDIARPLNFHVESLNCQRTLKKKDEKPWKPTNCLTIMDIRAGAESKTLGGQTYWEVEILGGQLGGQY